MPAILNGSLANCDNSHKELIAVSNRLCDSLAPLPLVGHIVDPVRFQQCVVDIQTFDLDAIHQGVPVLLRIPVAV